MTSFKKGQFLLFFLIIVCVSLVGIFVYKNLDINKSRDALTTEEIEKISRSIVALNCNTFNETDSRGLDIFGSGTFLTITEPVNDTNIDILLTNSHVAENPHIRNLEDDQELCEASFEQKENYYFSVFSDTTILDNNQDFSLLVPVVAKSGMIALNEDNNPLPFCNNITTGLKVYVFGYPGNSDSYELPPEPDRKYTVDSVKNWLEYNEIVREYNKSRNLILTEGIISGESDMGYYTTAKIDTGNSGGLAVSKQNGKICLVGIPTWVSIGEVENLGVIQPIENIYQAEINWYKLLQKTNKAVQNALPEKK